MLVPSHDLGGRRWAGTYGWLLVLPVVALACAAITIHALDNMSTSPLRWLPLTLGASAPALWIAARVAPGPLSITLVKIHAALYTGLVIVTFAMVPHHHANRLVPLLKLIDWLENVAVISGDAVFIAVASRRRKMSSSGRNSPRFVYVGLTVFLLAGWYAGLLAWSSALRPRLIAAAEAQVLDQPYCIEVDGRPMRTANDLTGLGMRARNEGGLTFSFHSLLVIGAGVDRTYLNWSYRSGQFEPVTLHARFALHLDDRVTCKPTMHFALNLR